MKHISHLRTCLCLFASLALLIQPGINAWAELPPIAYQQMQAEAPEELDIEVRSVKTSKKNEKDLVRTTITAEAEVKKVHRSQSKLKPGDIIRITYEQVEHQPGWAGPSQVPLLKEKQTCPAFLKKIEKEYQPAAGGYTFEKVK